MSAESLTFQFGSPTHASVHAEVFQSALYDRILSRTVEFNSRTWTCIFLSSGRLTRITPTDERIIVAPAFLWEPKNDGVRIRAHAGSNGTIMTLGETTLANAIGHRPEAAALRMMTTRDFVLSFETKEDIRDSARDCFAAILQELEANQTGKETIIEAQIRILLVLLWRAGISDVIQTGGYSNSTLTLERFRLLVEAHLRDRWTVARFAQELGISSDRLHDICTRTLAKPPQRLIQDRTVFEAQALLERSHQTIDQIADYLGFRNTSHFSAFFKTQTGFPPGAFRKAIGRKDQAAKLAQSRSHSDWP
ncbi:AraC family transcriptional regulator [Loktanella sp. SALINAS62]|uniref:helix-turn-helix domain-containing protein n=1 Tax=Loktanella sp. SALINAS62 TaxID=2706124 RepID=UPI001B8DA791|nr:AraC family transcriptional regulator [Loktanella sp. SALINAS62]MBS1301681.1 helix-turn-helix domain-containing protein [Loktanella sp. SALINAS62]